MEYLEGETVEQRMRLRGLFGIDEAMAIGQAVLAGLTIAHENQIVHRDLRPQNLFLTEIRGEEVLKILDFGVSRQFGGNDSTLTAPGTLLGGVGYLAPEQLYEDGVIDHRTDLYATGVLLYELLTGRMPFDGKGPTLLMEIVEKAPDSAEPLAPRASGGRGPRHPLRARQEPGRPLRGRREHGRSATAGGHLRPVRQGQLSPPGRFTRNRPRRSGRSASSAS